MATDVIKQIRRRTRRKFSADEKIRIVLEGLRVLHQGTVVDFLLELHNM